MTAVAPRRWTNHGPDKNRGSRRKLWKKTSKNNWAVKKGHANSSKSTQTFFCGHGLLRLIRRVVIIPLDPLEGETRRTVKLLAENWLATCALS